MKTAAGLAKVPRLLQDIIDNSARIEQFTAGMDLDSFSENEQKVDAVRYALLIISEAVSRLGHMTPHVMPSQPWEEFAALGDELQHRYDSIDKERLYAIVRDDLPGFHAAAKEGLHQWELFRLP